MPWPESALTAVTGGNCSAHPNSPCGIRKILAGGREGDARGKRYGDICIRITDSLCIKQKLTHHVKQLYSNKDVLKKKKERRILALCPWFLAQSS